MAGLPFVVAVAREPGQWPGEAWSALDGVLGLCPLSLSLPATSPAFPLALSRLFPVALPTCFLALPFIILALSLAFLPRPVAGSFSLRSAALPVTGRVLISALRARRSCGLPGSGRIRHIAVRASPRLCWFLRAGPAHEKGSGPLQCIRGIPRAHQPPGSGATLSIYSARTGAYRGAAPRYRRLSMERAGARRAVRAAPPGKAPARTRAANAALLPG
jgi:hypothetical protein